MPLRRFETDNVRVVLEKTVSNDGRISGLKKWRNKKAIIIIQDDENETKR